MRILLYTRPNSEQFLTTLAKDIDPAAQLYSISDFKGHGDIWAGKYLKEKNELDLFENDIYENIRLRCRFLRSLQKDTAYRLIRKYAYFVNQVFENFKPDMVLSQLPDNYCMDVIQRLAVLKSITLISMTGEFIHGYSRLTLRGERIDVREVSREEAQKVTDELLDKMYKPFYAENLGNTYKKHIKYIVRRKLIETFYYPLKKIQEGDPWNYHYNTIYYRGKKVSDIVNKKAEKLFTHISDLQDSENYIYVPLHCYPEATVDYYGDDPQFSLYEDFMIKVASEADKEIRLLIKEHPAMYGARSIDFYQKISRIDNVTLLHPYDNSNEVLNRCKYVLVFSGSVGVEAVIRNKVIFTLTSNYYSDLSPNIYLVKKLTADLLEKEYIPYDGVQFMQDMMCGLMDGKLGGQAGLIESDTKIMSNYIKKYYEKHPKQKLN